jgi:hypothetical protein
MNDSAPTSGAWKRIFIVIAVVYAIPVAFAFWTNFPTQSQINADTAGRAMAALQQHDPKYKDITPQSLRRRLYRGLSDEEVTARVREYAIAEDKRVNTQAGRISVDPQHAGMGIFSNSLAKPEEQLPGAAELGSGGMRPQIALTMEDLEKQREERLASLKAGQIKVIAWAIGAWVLPLVALYFLVPLFLDRSRRSQSRL